MFINHVLTLNGYKVINGYSDILTPFLGAAGGEAGALGWWANLRSFSIDRFGPASGGGRLPIQRYLSKMLFNRITFAELDQLRNLVPGILNNLPSDALYDPATGSMPQRNMEVIQSWDAVKSLNDSLLTGNQSTSLQNCATAVKKAGAAYDVVQRHARLDQKSNAEHLQPLADATGQMPLDKLDTYLIAGELSLSGKTRATSGGLALALLARKLGKAGVLLPAATAEEAALVENVPVYAVTSLDEAMRFLSGEKFITRLDPAASPFRRPPDTQHHVDFSEVKGQHALRRAVEVAVAGGHNLLMVGSPGAGKSMIAKRIPTIMPEPSLDEFLEVLAIQSAAGISLAPENRCFQRPFRAPHHTISDVGLLGGGTIPGPGEISLAHHGVLFMDELPEFKRSTLEVLRQPLEDGEVSISRSAGKITLPSAVMLVAAMNLCPCGYMGDAKRECRCTVPQIQRYRSRISGPLLDRIDLHVEAPSLPLSVIQSDATGETSAAMRERIVSARKRQEERFAGSRLRNTPCNSRMSQAQIRTHCAIDKASAELLTQAMEQLSLSARAYDRVLKVARTIADLAGTDRIELPHLLEAIQYRSLDRALFY